jgi:PAS domain S-box-containing protein
VTVSDSLARRLLDAAPDPIVVVKPNGIITYANARLRDVLGYEPDELLGNAVEILVPHRYHAVHSKHRTDYLGWPKSRPMGTELELYAVHKDGHEIAVEISLSPLETETGLLISAAIRDVSAQKEIARQLVEANRAKSRFLAAASHDLRQPLQALNLLNRAAGKTVTDRVHRTIIEKQQSSLDSMSALLNSLLDISKLEAGIVKPDIADCNVHEIFESLRAEFELQARDRGLELIVDECRDVARSDSRLLTQVLENLIANAIRYTREGFVQLRCLHCDLSVRIEVLDTGLGIPVDELDRIFDEFHQVDRGERRTEGLGLGLSIVKRTAQLLGCVLEVDSSPGRGSVFSVTVPKGDGSSVPRLATEHEAPPNVGGGLILIIDDEAAVVDATRMLLETEGFDVLTAGCHDEAIAHIDAQVEVLDLLISDYHLGEDETGLDVIRAVRDRARRAVPAILVSGDTSDTVPAHDLKHVTFLTKPVDIDALLSAIRAKIESPFPRSYR